MHTELASPIVLNVVSSSPAAMSLWWSAAQDGQDRGGGA